MHNAIDSCSLFIPLSKLIDYSSALTATVADIDLDTGEISNPRNNADVKIENLGYSTYYKLIRKQVNKEVVTGVQLSVTSKHLRHDYLVGITNNTLATLHEAIVSEGIINCSLNDFVNALIQDVDIKKDVALGDDVTFNEFTNQIKQAVNTGATGKLNLVKRYASDVNQGIEFGTRTNSNKLPHFKIYNKQIELANNSLEFRDAYNINVVNNVRLEVNLKNRKMLIKHNLLNTTERATLNNVMGNLKRFNMSSIARTYIHGESPEDKAARVNNAYEECRDSLKVAGVVKLCVLLNMTLDETIKETLAVHMPGKNKVGFYKRVATRLYLEKFGGENGLAREQGERILKVIGL